MAWDNKEMPFANITIRELGMGDNRGWSFSSVGTVATKSTNLRLKGHLWLKAECVRPNQLLITICKHTNMILYAAFATLALPDCRPQCPSTGSPLPSIILSKGSWGSIVVGGVCSFINSITSSLSSSYYFHCVSFSNFSIVLIFYIWT